MMDKRLLDILACPICKSPLDYFAGNEKLVCRAERLVFPIRAGIPVLLEEECEHVSSEDLEAMDRHRSGS